APPPGLVEDVRDPGDPEPLEPFNRYADVVRTEGEDRPRSSFDGGRRKGVHRLVQELDLRFVVIGVGRVQLAPGLVRPVLGAVAGPLAHPEPEHVPVPGREPPDVGRPKCDRRESELGAVRARTHPVGSSTSSPASCRMPANVLPGTPSSPPASASNPRLST